ncbi:hypothetical protein BTRA_1142 [Burkholderia thailandensis USAMRU Malaysia |uniref:Uncharacterized protein n=1 Tax=Burkholderia thailandensis (strain ATCC 700388 / DSM 13276 / CCUG 48851 / CIP 106301 / E264) TaxID=271848 RepID=Q2SZ61_BURTA|nr:hypothetical protein BTH_I1241 [Burkholderia thailandensis E264]AHI63550.1 hypothetical protein BTL_935 [Burkholderia thailandensis H0587]AHI73538.1 hypothetical protein BTQ_2690 [Burkholderia thailandensis 2002721723]AHI79986.1 hypothetical protein BTJ_3004 [Burkholderia thailandensis E444]AIC87243.1 hypothetical protein BTRA_1142 [Burkholderia thailandensis USAMRU Malaysia \
MSARIAAWPGMPRAARGMHRGRAAHVTLAHA